jgi:hypothetical protein
MRIFFSVLGLALITSGAFAQDLDLEDQTACIEAAVSDSSKEGSCEISNLDRAILGAISIGRGTAEIGRAAVGVADERAPEVMDTGRNLVGQASGFFETTRDRFRLLANDEAP